MQISYLCTFWDNKFVQKPEISQGNLGIMFWIILCAQIKFIFLIHFTFFIFWLWEPKDNEIVQTVRFSNNVFLSPIRSLSNFIGELKQHIMFFSALEPKNDRKFVKLPHSSLHKLSHPSICKSIIYHFSEVVLMQFNHK